MTDRIQDAYEVLQQREMRILKYTKAEFLGRTIQLLWMALWNSKSGYYGLFCFGALFRKGCWKIRLNSKKRCINMLWFALLRQILVTGCDIGSYGEVLCKREFPGGFCACL